MHLCCGKYWHSFTMILWCTIVFLSSAFIDARHGSSFIYTWAQHCKKFTRHLRLSFSSWRWKFLYSIVVHFVNDIKLSELRNFRAVSIFLSTYWSIVISCIWFVSKSHHCIGNHTLQKDVRCFPGNQSVKKLKNIFRRFL